METTHKILVNNIFVGFAFIVRHQQNINASISVFEVVQGRIYLQKYDRIDCSIIHDDNAVLNFLYQRANLDTNNIERVITSVLV
jgi:hypothetical protein